MLTVAVSISSGAQYAASAIPALSGHEAIVASALVLVLMAMNLRGIRESGTFFAVPTYALHGRASSGCALYGLLLGLTGDLPDVESADLDHRAGARLRGRR